MKYFHIDSQIDKELLNKFLEFANNNIEENWTIVIYTVGGTNVFAKSILHIINQRKDKVSIICNEAYSAGFCILYGAKCKKYLTQDCRGMIHMRSADINMQPTGKPSYTEDRCLIKNWKHHKSEDYNWIKKFMTDKEIKRYKRGNDIFFTFKRMKEIFPDAEII